MKKTIADLMDELEAIDKCLDIQWEIKERIRKKEILLDEAYMKPIDETRTFLYELRNNILRIEVEI